MLSVSNKTRQGIPALPFLAIAERVLGKTYDVSLVFVGDQRSHKLNRTYRGKDKPTNVLAFPYDSKHGEIFINLKKTKAECQKFGHTFPHHLGYLFIHGLLHLKGMDHGSTMERKEAKLIKDFLDGTNNHHRLGHRHLINSRRRMRI